MFFSTLECVDEQKIPTKIMATLDFLDIIDIGKQNNTRIMCNIFSWFKTLFQKKSNPNTTKPILSIVMKSFSFGSYSFGSTNATTSISSRGGSASTQTDP